MSFVAGERARASVLNALVPQADVGTYAEYNSNNNQTISNNTQPVIWFPTANRTSTLVTPAVDGVGHRFTLNRAGLWMISTTIRWVSATGGERYTLIGSSDGGLASQSDVLPASLGGPVTSNVAVCRYFIATAWVRVECFQNAGANRDLESSNPNGWGRINLAWIHA